MIPISDDNSYRRSVPFVNYALIGLNFLAFFYELALMSGQNQNGLDAFFNSYAVTPAHISAGQDYYTLITSQFLHGGWAHLLGNMLYLFIFGDNVEDVFGHIPYLIYYLFCGVIAGLSQVLVDPNSMVVSLGASGAIAGVLGTYLVLFPRAQVRVLIFIGFIFFWPRITAIFVIGFWFVTQFINGVAALSPVTAQTGGGGVAYWAHIGGFVAGAVIGLIARQFIRVPVPGPPPVNWSGKQGPWGGYGPRY